MSFTLHSFFKACAWSKDMMAHFWIVDLLVLDSIQVNRWVYLIYPRILFRLCGGGGPRLGSTELEFLIHAIDFASQPPGIFVVLAGVSPQVDVRKWPEWRWRQCWLVHLVWESERVWLTCSPLFDSHSVGLTHSHSELHQKLTSATFILLKITWEQSENKQNIWRRVVVWLLINISPWNVFQKMLL